MFSKHKAIEYAVETLLNNIYALDKSSRRLENIAFDIINAARRDNKEWDLIQWITPRYYIAYIHRDVDDMDYKRYSRSEIEDFIYHEMSEFTRSLVAFIISERAPNELRDLNDRDYENFKSRANEIRDIIEELDRYDRDDRSGGGRRDDRRSRSHDRERGSRYNERDDYEPQRNRRRDDRRDRRDNDRNDDYLNGSYIGSNAEVEIRVKPNGDVERVKPEKKDRTRAPYYSEIVEMESDRRYQNEERERKTYHNEQNRSGKSYHSDQGRNGETHRDGQSRNERAHRVYNSDEELLEHNRSLREKESQREAPTGTGASSFKRADVKRPVDEKPIIDFGFGGPDIKDDKNPIGDFIKDKIDPIEQRRIKGDNYIPTKEELANMEWPTDYKSYTDHTLDQLAKYNVSGINKTIDNNIFTTAVPLFPGPTVSTYVITVDSAKEEIIGGFVSVKGGMKIKHFNPYNTMLALKGLLSVIKVRPEDERTALLKSPFKPNVVETGKADRFKRNNDFWVVAFKCKWEPNEPPICYNSKSGLLYYVMDEDGVIRQEIEPVNDKNRYLQHELNTEFANKLKEELYPTKEVIEHVLTPKTDPLDNDGLVKTSFEYDGLDEEVYNLVTSEPEVIENATKFSTSAAEGIAYAASMTNKFDDNKIHLVETNLITPVKIDPSTSKSVDGLFEGVLENAKSLSMVVKLYRSACSTINLDPSIYHFLGSNFIKVYNKICRIIVNEPSIVFNEDCDFFIEFTKREAEIKAKLGEFNYDELNSTMLNYIKTAFTNNEEASAIQTMKDRYGVTDEDLNGYELLNYRFYAGYLDASLHDLGLMLRKGVAEICYPNSVPHALAKRVTLDGTGTRYPNGVCTVLTTKDGRQLQFDRYRGNNGVHYTIMLVS